MIKKYDNRVVFSVGTGRCGTNFIYKVLSMEKGIASSHERNPINETFHRYCKWYGLPVDHEGFLNTKQLEIDEDLNKNRISFESSAHLSLSIVELYERFGAKFILLVRNPESVINSYIQKGWYSDATKYADNSLIPGFQPNTSKAHHYFGRITPVGEQLDQWNSLTRVGKLAWYWSNLNEHVLKQFELLPDDKKMVVRLEDADYKKYLEICDFIGHATSVDQKTYKEISKSRPNKARIIKTIRSWSEIDIEQFDSNISEIARYLDYSGRYSDLKKPKEEETIQDKSLGIRRFGLTLKRKIRQLVRD